MLDILYVVDEVRRSDGGIQLPPEAPTEVPPWAEPLSPDEQRRVQTRLFRLTLNPPDPQPQDAAAVQLDSDKTPPPSPSPCATDGTRLNYSRLATGADNDEIRILRLLPGKGAEPLRCELIHVPLASPGEYDAVSYRWGPPTPEHTLHCNGFSVSVMSNLAEALRAFRLPGSPRLLWVDALCINQEDLSEKGHQVPLMGRIYRGASAVRIWLGNDTPSQPITEALDILRNVYRLCVRFGWDLNFAFILLFDDRLRKESGLPDLADNAWRSVKYLIQMPWFSRSWIIQEVVLSREAYLHSSSTSLPWIEFCIGFLALIPDMLAMRVDMIPNLTACAQVFELILSYHKARAASTSLNILAFLENHRVAQATEPRDKIYAFLGIHDELAGDRAHGILPNYLSPVREVYIDAAMRIIQHANSLDVLGMAGHRDNAIDKLPSWVPDWSTSDLTSALSYKTIDGAYLYNFNAAGNTPAISCPAIFQGDLIQLNGFCFDQAVTVGDVAELLLRKESTAVSIAAVIPQTAALLLSWLRQSGSLEHGRKYPDGQDMLEAFIKTIFLDDIPDDMTMKGATAIRLLFFPSQFIKQQWIGREKITVIGKLGFLCGGALLRLLGPGGLQWLAKTAKKIEDKRPVSFRSGIRYASQFDNADKTEHAQGRQAGFVRLRSLYRRLFVTKGGYMGLGPPQMQSEDQVFLVRGSRTPLVFRHGKLGRYELVGDCYVGGIMQGEAFDEEKCEPFMVV